MTIRFTPIRFVRGCVATCVLCGGSLLAQDRTPAIIADGSNQQSSAHVGLTTIVPSSWDYATALLGNYDLVALGVFGDFPPRETDLFESLAPGETKLRFKIQKLYKGHAADSIEVSLNTDMLTYPGESISRYAKRQQVRRNQISAATEFNREFAQLEERLRIGAIDKQQYDDQFARLEIGKDKLVRESVATSTRLVTVVGAMTFYDLGGAIGPDRKFLIGVNRSLEHLNVYTLEEVPTKGTDIFWGQVLEDVSRALDTARDSSR